MGKIYGCGTNYKKYWGGLLTTKVTSVRRPAYQVQHLDNFRPGDIFPWICRHIAKAQIRSGKYRVIHIAVDSVQFWPVCRNTGTGKQRLVRPAPRYPTVHMQVRLHDNPIPPAHYLGDRLFHWPFLVREESPTEHHGHFPVGDEPIRGEGVRTGANGDPIVIGVADGFGIAGTG